MSMAEYIEWQAFDRLSPIDESARQDLRFAVLNQTVYGSQGIKTRADDFMPRWDREANRPSAKEVENKFRIFAQFHNQANRLHREREARKTGQKG